MQGNLLSTFHAVIARKFINHLRQFHRAHEPLHALAVDDMPEPAQAHHHAPTVVKRPACVLLVDQPTQPQIFFILIALDDPPIHAFP